MQNTFSIKKSDVLRALKKFNTLIEDIKYVGKGRYSKVFLLNEDMVFKFPTNKEACEVISKEIKVLNFIDGKISINIPRVQYHHKYGKCPFICMSRINGISLNKRIFNKLNIEHQQKIIKELASFFSQMHKLKIDENAEKILEKIDFETATKNFFLKQYRLKISKHLTKEQNIFIEESFNNYLGDKKNFEYEPVIVHGDLHLENMFFNQETNEISGIIDFGDVNIADNVYDFRYLDLYFGREFTRNMLKFYDKPIIGNMFAKLEIFNLCNFICDALFALKQKKDKEFKTAIKCLQKTIRQYKKYRTI